MRSSSKIVSKLNLIGVAADRRAPVRQRAEISRISCSFERNKSIVTSGLILVRKSAVTVRRDLVPAAAAKKSANYKISWALNITKKSRNN